MINYFSRFLAHYGSEIPSTPWNHITTLTKSECSVADLVSEKSSYTIMKPTEKGVFLHRYELAQD